MNMNWQITLNEIKAALFVICWSLHLINLIHGALRDN